MDDQYAVTAVSDPVATARMIDREFKECSPRQFLRELVVNSIEATTRCDGPGRVLVLAHELDGVRKLSVVDNGDGIPEDTLLKKLQLGVYQRDENYGLGVKISLLPISRAGTMYISQSAEDEVPYEACIVHERKAYRFKRYTTPDGFNPACAADWTHPIIEKDGRGTQVVVIGSTQHEDTTVALANDPRLRNPGSLRWSHDYLQGKVWKLPPRLDVGVMVRENKNGDTKYKVTGGEPMMKKYAGKMGTVRLDEHQVHWFLLKEMATAKHNQASFRAGPWARGNIVGAIHCEPYGLCEMYGMKQGATGALCLKHFGVSYGGSRVVLVIEPLSEKSYSPTGNRGDLIYEGEQGVTITEQYPAIGHAFRSAMAEQAPVLFDYVRDASANAFSKADKDAISRQRATLRSVFGAKDYRRVVKGGRIVTHDADGDFLQTGTGGGSVTPSPVPGPTPANPNSLQRKEPGDRVRPSTKRKSRAKLIDAELPERQVDWDQSPELPMDVVCDYERVGETAIFPNRNNFVYKQLLNVVLEGAEPGTEGHIEDALQHVCSNHLVGLIDAVELQYRVMPAATRNEWFTTKAIHRINYDALTSGESHQALRRKVAALAKEGIESELSKVAA